MQRGKNEVYKTVIGEVTAHVKPQKNHPFVRFVNYDYVLTGIIVMMQYITLHL